MKNLNLKLALLTFQIFRPNQPIDIESSKEDSRLKMIGNIKKRRKFIYSFKDMIWELFWLHKWKSTIKSWESMGVRNKIFREGIELFHSELDFAYIVKSIRELKVLVGSILDQEQQSLLQFHQTRLLDLNNPILKEIKYSTSPQIKIPKEKDNQNSIIEYERKVSEGRESLLYKLIINKVSKVKF